MGAIERKQKQKDTLRANMLQAARTIALRESWQAVTIRKIADEIEYSAPIVYEYFENKDALLMAIVSDGFQSMRQELELLIMSNSNAATRLMAVAQMHWKFSMQHPELYQLMFSLYRKAINQHLISAEILKGRGVILAIFRELVSDENELESVFFNWICLMHGFISMAMLCRESPPPHRKDLTSDELNRLYEQAIERFVKSLK